MTEKERFKTIVKLIDFDINKKDNNDNPLDIIYGNNNIRRNLPIFLLECHKLFLELSKPDLLLDRREMDTVWDLINKIEDIQFEEKFKFEFFTESSFIKLLISYRLFFIKIASHYFKESEFYKNLSERQRKEYENTIDELKINPKGYDIAELVDFYLKIAKAKKDIPSLRDLALRSKYSKDKWKRKIYEDVEFILTILGRLNKYKEKYSKELYKKLYNYWTKKFGDVQKKDMKMQNISNAKEYDDNIQY